MPWKVGTMSELRRCFVQEVLELKKSVSSSCRKYGISRKTGYKWLARYRANPECALVEHSRRPQHTPGRTEESLEQEVLSVRAEYGWGAQKIHDYLLRCREAAGLATRLPSERTIGNILRRHGKIVIKTGGEPVPVQFFERSQPNELWQCDFKGPLEVERRKVHPFTILDDHSRYLLALRTCLDVTMHSAWEVLWQTFGEYGLPQGLLCDNAFGTQFTTIPSLSWFESQLIRLGIQPLHGRPYHPQTQGKVERLHGTLEREVWPHVDRSLIASFDLDVNRWRTKVYNVLRPHESLGGHPPLSRYEPSPRPRPTTLPEVSYPAGSVLRRVANGGDISWAGCRILIGRGLHRQLVRIEEIATGIEIYYSWKRVRALSDAQLVKGFML